MPFRLSVSCILSERSARPPTPARPRKGGGALRRRQCFPTAARHMSRPPCFAWSPSPARGRPKGRPSSDGLWQARPMHILRIETRSLDETVEAVDLGQTPADVVFLSFSDSDLNALARAYDAAPEPKPTLRLASLAALRHPYSIDLYLERVCAQAKLIVARVLGGADYWRYGVDELAALARKEGIKLALLPGDRRADARLDQASTLAPEAAAEIWRYFDEGGPLNMAACLARLRGGARRGEAGAEPSAGQRLRPLRGGLRRGRARRAAGADRLLPLDLSRGRPRADRGPRERTRRPRLCDDRGLCDEPQGRGGDRALARADRGGSLRRRSQRDRLFRPPRRRRGNRSRFHRRAGAAGRAGGRRGRRLARLSARPRAGGSRHACRPAGDRRADSDPRRLLQGRERRATPRPNSAPSLHRPLADRVAFVAELASAWARLRRKPPAEKRLACVLPDYPARGGRTGYAVGLDTPASAAAIAGILRAAGYDVTADCDAASLIAALSEGPLEPTLSLAEYEAELAVVAARVPQRRARRLGRPGRRSLPDRRRVPLPLRPPRQADRRGPAGPRRPGSAQGRLSRPDAGAAPFLRRVPFLAHAQGADRRAHPARRARHARMAAGQGRRAVEVLRARGPPRPDAGDLSVHRQQSRRGGAGQAADRRGDDRPSDAAADRRRLAWGRARARGPVRRIFRGAGARSAPRARHRGADPRARPRDRACSANAPPRASRRRRRCSRSTPGSAISRTCGSATACTCSAARRTPPRASLPGSCSTKTRPRR